MKRLRLLILLTICVAYSTTGGVASQSNDTDKLLLMVYMNGSDLESANSLATTNITEMVSALQRNPQSQNLDVLIMMGGTKIWHVKPPLTSDTFDNSNIYYGSVTYDGISKVASMPLASIGAPSTLTNFLDYAVANYSAQRYGLIFWNHGSGAVKGFGHDELFTDDTNLSVAEISRALSASSFGGSRKLEFVGFDACLMATLETAVAVAPYAEYMVASQELEPGEGWDYNAILATILSNPKIECEELTKVIVDSFIAKCDSRDLATLSVMKLDAIQNLNSRVEELALDIYSDIQQNGDYIDININMFRNLSNLRNVSKSYGVAQSSYLGTDMVDIDDFCQNISLKMGYSSRVDSISEQLKKVIVYAKKTTQLAYDNICGVSLYFPNDNIYLARNLSDYYECGFNSAYLDLVALYTQKMLAGYGSPKIENIVTDSSSYLLSTEVLLNMRELHSIILSRYKGQWVSLGVDNDGLRISDEGSIEMRDYSNNVMEEWDKRWIMVGGEVVSAYLTQSSKRGLLYSIPIYLNGSLANMQLRYDDSNPQGVIDGARVIIDEVTPGKGVVVLKDSDEITILHEIFNDSDDSIIYIEAGHLSPNNLNVQLSKLPQGEYRHGFCIEDLYGRKYYTPFVDYTIR